MTPELASMIWGVIGIYLGVGVIMALVFLIILIKRASLGARTAAPLQMRLVIFPACVLLWPIIIVRGLTGAPGGGDHEASA